MKKIPIFFSFNNDYAAQAAVAFLSLLSNANKDVYYEMYVLYTDINQENQKKIKETLKHLNNFCLYFILLSKKINFEFNNDKFNEGDNNVSFTKETLYRCLPTLIPEFNQYKKIIYSDVDIVVIDDISELFDINLKNNYLAAVKNPKFLEHQIKHLKKLKTTNYFSGGLWVMNLEQIRKDNLTKKIIEIIDKPPMRLIWNDQDIMNIACDNKITYLSYQYVSIPCWFNQLKEVDFKDEYYPNNELYKAMYSPKIIHYAAFKPWNDVFSFRAGIWFYWFNKTTFFLKEKQNLFKKIYKKLVLTKFTILLLLGLIPYLNKKFNYEENIRKINEELMIY